MQNGLGAPADFCAEINGAKHLRAQRTPRFKRLLSSMLFAMLAALLACFELAHIGDTNQSVLCT